MKKLFAVFALTLLAVAAFAADPAPMVDIRVDIENVDARMTTDVPGHIGSRIGQAYLESMTAAIQERGQLDILAVGKRATVVITGYYNPDDALGRVLAEQDERAMPGRPMFHPSNPRTQAAMTRDMSRPLSLQLKARISGYIDFEGKRMPFDEVALGAGSIERVADEVGRGVFRRILAS